MTIQMLIHFIEIICFSVFFAELSNVPQTLMWWLCKKNIVYKVDIYNSKQPRRCKPFDCAMCLSFWIGFVYCLSNYNGIVNLIGFSSLCSIGAVVLINILNKLKSLNL
jgi:hypothetical protein